METRISRKTLLRGAVLAAVTLSLTSAAAISLWPHKARAACGGGGNPFHFNAGLGNGSELGDPGNSGAHNQAGNAPAHPHSAAAQADTAHEVDDADEPN